MRIGKWVSWDHFLTDLLVKYLKIYWAAVLDPSWINEKDTPELGFRFGPLLFLYYKWNDPTVRWARGCPNRPMNKREFGESIRAIV